VALLFLSCRPPVSPQIQSGFFEAILAGDYAQADKSLEMGANVNALSTDNYSIRVEKLKLNAFVSTGQTALHMTSFYGKTDGVKWLLKKGADVNARDTDMDTPLLKALLGGLTLYDSLDIASYLIEKGADINAQGKGGWTPLLNAAWGCKTDFTRMLLERGANINAKTSKGWTALHIAVRGCDIDIIKLLLEKGADVNSKDNEGQTPIQIAKQEEKTDVIAILQSYGGRE
jgi:ankyrin repeat protein